MHMINNNVTDYGFLLMDSEFLLVDFEFLLVDSEFFLVDIGNPTSGFRIPTSGLQYVLPVTDSRIPSPRAKHNFKSQEQNSLEQSLK